MSNFSAGQLIRISNEVIPETAKDDELLGELGVPGLLRHAIFEITDTRNDESRGPIVVCKITNPEVFKQVIPGVKEVKYEGELILLESEIQLANITITLDYIIENGKNREEMVKDLFTVRAELRARGLDKKSREMRDNWKQIQVMRGEIKGPVPSTANKVSVRLPKQRITIEVDRTELPGTDEESQTKFKRLLTNKVRSIRRQRNVDVTENKVVFGSIPVKKSGGVYLQEGSLLKAYEEMMKTTLETDKKPTDSKATYVGVEIEFVYSGKYEVLKQLLIDKKLHRYVCLKGDPSVRACHNNQGYSGLELTMICKTKELEDVLKKLDSVFTHPEIDGFANRSCGLHVHLDMRNRDVALAYKNLVRIQNILRGSQPVGRIKNIHCRPNDNDKFNAEGEGDVRTNRYWVVNGSSYSKHKSIEIRIHEGTTDCEAIYNWASFLNAVASHKAEIPKNEIKFAEDLASRFGVDIPAEAIKYVDKRIERFKSLAAV